MSQAAQPILAGPTQPARRRRFPLAVFALVVVVVLAIPGGAFAYAGNELSQGRSLESQGIRPNHKRRHVPRDQLAADKMDEQRQRDPDCRRRQFASTIGEKYRGRKK